MTATANTGRERQGNRQSKLVGLTPSPHAGVVNEPFTSAASSASQSSFPVKHIDSDASSPSESELEQRRFSPLMSPALSDMSISHGLSPSGFLSPTGLTPLTSPMNPIMENRTPSVKLSSVGLRSVFIPTSASVSASVPASASFSSRSAHSSWSGGGDDALPPPLSSDSARGPARGLGRSPGIALTQRDLLNLLGDTSPQPVQVKPRPQLGMTGGHAAPSLDLLTGAPAFRVSPQRSRGGPSRYGER